ncbi:MAG: hypothetical protein U0Y68_16490 [Blastocatellia bacterium]
MSIQGDRFFINGRPTYEGRTYQGMKIEGLLLNSRMIQGIYDDLNPATRSRWAYPDTGKWDAERNTREFIAAMPEWRKHGLLAFTINLQGGSPQGYSREQPWHNSAINADGSLRDDYLQRLARIINRADQLGMVVILGYFYFGQDERVKDEAAIKRAVVNATNWLHKNGWRNVLIEINNECDYPPYDHEILKATRVHELIELAKTTTQRGYRYPVGTSFRGNATPTSNVIRASDFLLLHGNSVSNPNRITEMIEITRRDPAYRPMPILFNEDDHFDFDKPVNNMLKALGGYASWGYFDPGKSDYSDGYQCPPVNWGINTERKKAFFNLLKQITKAS